MAGFSEVTKQRVIIQALSVSPAFSCTKMAGIINTAGGINHLSEEVKKHEMPSIKVDSYIKFSSLGEVNSATQLDGR